jgi:RNA polymerase sigma-70 factor (ECF subfamily)
MLGSLVAKPIGDEKRLEALRVTDLRADTFRGLVDRQLDGAYRLAGVILNDRIEAEDAVHEAAVAAWRGFAGLRDPTRFDAWFRRILVNECRDRLRDRARRARDGVSRKLIEAEHPRIADASEATAARDALDRAVVGLTLDEQVVVTLRFYSDLTVPGIAEVLRIPEGTVKSRLHHAMGRLRTALEVAER